MKQVTMESVKQRIAVLESAGKIVGVLGLGGEFELACLRELVAVTEQRDALVVENVGLLRFGDKLNDMRNNLNGEGTGIQGRAEVACQQIALESAMEEFDAIKTPATDAARASLRAEGVEWIEGAEPEKFGRYWVRYETDVGPQYCSAQWMEYNFCASSDTNIHKIWQADHSRSINQLRNVTHYTRFPEPIERGAK